METKQPTLNELEQFIKVFQKLDETLWEERLRNIIWYTLWTFTRQYSREDELDVMVGDIQEYIEWKNERLDKDSKEDKKYEEERQEEIKKFKEMKKNIKRIIDMCK